MLADWLDQRTSRSPGALSARVRHHALAAPSAESRASSLARAASRALDQVLAQPGDRSAALDLLAADGLITLALLAQAEDAPERLGDFARRLLTGGDASPP